jgi:hypothetical protein
MWNNPLKSIFGGTMSRMARGFLLVAMLIAITGISGCIGSVALDRAVIDYDTTTAQSISKQLLLNIARARYNQPMHFTAISSIAATYKFSVSAGSVAHRPGRTAVNSCH